MNRYAIPGFLQHHTHPGGNKNEVRMENEKTEQDKIQIYNKKHSI